MAQGSLRDRRRADTVAEIKGAALGLLAAGGAEALTLRAVAREVGVTVQALYHYFASRDALITELVTDAFTSLGDAVIEGGKTGRHRNECIVGAGLAYRNWASSHRPEFLLALGGPLPDYTASKDGPTTAAAERMGMAFHHVVFDGWTHEQMQAVPTPHGSAAPATGHKGLSPGALQLFVIGWASLHGFVMLEAHGHLTWADESGEVICRGLLENYAETVERARTR